MIPRNHGDVLEATFDCRLCVIFTDNTTSHFRGQGQREGKGGVDTKQNRRGKKLEGVDRSLDLSYIFSSFRTSINGCGMFSITP
jgi:hypothetical protein